MHLLSVICYYEWTLLFVMLRHAMILIVLLRSYFLNVLLVIYHDPLSIVHFLKLLSYLCSNFDFASFS